MANNRPRSDEDTEAILNRRRFLIESTMAGAGIGAVLSGCEAQPGLKIKPEPRQCLDVPPDPPTSKPTEPQVCLSVEISRPKTPPASSQPAVCLEVKVKPPKTTIKPYLPPRPCLSERIRD